MSETLAQGEAFRQADDQAERRRTHNKAVQNSRANQKARARYVGDSSLTAEELLAEQRRLRDEMYARRAAA